MEQNHLDEIKWATEGIVQNHPRHCYDVFHHIEMVVERLQDGGAPEWLIDVGWLHDVGKPFVKAVNPKTGFDTFYHHQLKSVDWAKEKGIVLDSRQEWFILHHEDPLTNLEKLDDEHKRWWPWLRAADLYGQNTMNQDVKMDFVTVDEMRRALVNKMLEVK